MKSHRVKKEVKRVVSCFSLIAAIFLTSCLKTDIYQQDELEEGKPQGGGSSTQKISFDMSIGMVADADFKNMWKDGDKIGLFAVRHAPGVEASLKVSGNYLHNKMLTYNENTETWSSDSPIYFPAGNDQLDFYAYYPYNSKATNPTRITFNVNTDQSAFTSGQSNYNLSNVMFSNDAMNVDSQTPSVSLFFSHAFAIVQLNVHDSYGAIGEVTATVQGCMTTAFGDLRSGTFERSGTAKDVKMSRLEKPGDGNYNTSFTYRAFLPVQRISKGNQLFQIKAGSRAFDSSSLTQDASLSEGEVERFSINQRFYKIGDYYPDKRNPIGIVFSLNDPIISQLAEHGKIVSLDEPPAQWSGGNNPEGCLTWGAMGVGTKTVDNENGAENMSKIKALGIASYPAFKWCDDRTEGGKKWYLPCITELKAIHKQEKDLNAKLIAIGKSKFSDERYWTSIERDEGLSEAWFVYFGIGNGDVFVLLRDKNCRVRAVTTF